MNSAPRSRPVHAGLAPETLLEAIVTSLDDAKGEDIVTIDLTGKTAIADAMVIASGRSRRHVSAIAELLVKALKEKGYRELRVEGLETGEWVLIDAGDVIVHVFQPEIRDFYNLEKMWSAARPDTHQA
jgi:ribosome-associated protein